MIHCVMDARLPAFAACALLASAAIAPSMAFAQNHAAPSIRLVVAGAAGSPPDALARILGEPLAASGQSVVVENRPGAGGALAFGAVARAAPDGHTLAIVGLPQVVAPALAAAQGRDRVPALAPVTQLVWTANVLVVRAASPLRSASDLVAQAKANPGAWSYASAGNGTAPHYAAELFKLNAGVVMLGVPYKGSAPAITDTIGGQTQFMFPSLYTALPYVKSGKLRALAVAGPKRSPLLPDVPTLKEAGVDGVDVQQWYGFFAPANTPRPIIDQLNKAINQVLKDKEIEKRIEEHGADVETSTPEQLGALVKSELEKWKGVVQRAKMTAE